MIPQGHETICCNRTVLPIQGGIKAEHVYPTCVSKLALYSIFHCRTNTRCRPYNLNILSLISKKIYTNYRLKTIELFNFKHIWRLYQFWRHGDRDMAYKLSYSALIGSWFVLHL